MSKIKVTQIRSTIGSKPKTRGSLRSLGLRGIGQSNAVARGSIARVSHLITVEEV